MGRSDSGNTIYIGLSLTVSDSSTCRILSRRGGRGNLFSGYPDSDAGGTNFKAYHFVLGSNHMIVVRIPADFDNEIQKYLITEAMHWLDVI